MGSIRARVRDPCLAQHLEVVRQRRLRDRCLDGAARLLAVVGQLSHDLEPNRVAQRMQHVGERDLLDVRVMQATH